MDAPERSGAIQRRPVDGQSLVELMLDPHCTADHAHASLAFARAHARQLYLPNTVPVHLPNMGSSFTRPHQPYTGTSSPLARTLPASAPTASAHVTPSI